MLKKQMSGSVRAKPDNKEKPLRRRVRLLPQARERMILDAAIEFFAEEGFRAQTRGLADRLGVSQSLIYRYFGSKEELIERVYEKTFLSRWNPAWEKVLVDKQRPLPERLKDFLRSYLVAVDDRTWIRVAMHSSLEGSNLTRRYIQGPVTQLLSKLVHEIRVDSGLPAQQPSEMELELAWHLHSTIIYYLIRKHIHETPVSLDIDGIAAMIADNFLNGIQSNNLADNAKSKEAATVKKAKPVRGTSRKRVPAGE